MWRKCKYFFYQFFSLNFQTSIVLLIFSIWFLFILSIWPKVQYQQYQKNDYVYFTPSLEPPCKTEWVCLVFQAKTRLSNQSNDSPPDPAPAKECVILSAVLLPSSPFGGILIRYFTPLVGLLSLLSLPGWDETFNSLKRPIRRLRRNVWWFRRDARLPLRLIRPFCCIVSVCVMFD